MKPFNTITGNLTLENEFKAASLSAEVDSCTDVEQVKSMAKAAIKYGLLYEQNFKAIIKEQMYEDIGIKKA